ncbi:MAG TPA: S8 family serine peptidase, partial [Pyrinomonadaceae bacterium]
MRKKTFIGFTSASLIMTLLLTTLVFGQNTTLPKKQNQSNKDVKTSVAGNEYVENLSQEAIDGRIQPVLGLEAETEKVAKILSGKDRRGTIITDRYGSKRFAVVENIAVRMSLENTTAGLSGKTLLKINLGKIIGDSSNARELNVRLTGVLQFVKSFGEKAVVFVEDFSSFSNENPLFGNQVAATLRDSLTKENIKFISAGTNEDVKSQFVADNFLKRNFRQIDLNEDNENSEDAFVGDKLSPDLRELIANAAPGDKVKVILQSDDINNSELRAVLQENGVTIETRAENLNMLVVDLPVRAAEAVAAAHASKHLSLDKDLKILGHVDMTTGVLAARAQTGNSTLDGRGIGIAIVDSGIFESHHTFVGDDGSKRITEGKDVVGNNNSDKDEYGHGTHVAALAAGRGGKPGDINSINILKNYQGTAPAAKIIPVRALDDKGRGSTAKLIEAINWIYTNRTK